MATSAAKRKVHSEGRVFNAQWTNDYFFIECKGKPMCLICKEVLSVLKEYNVQRHYETKHKEKFDGIQGSLRSIKIDSLKSSLCRQQNIFKKQCTRNEAGVRASYIVARKIAETGRPFTEGDFIKTCMLSVMEEVCPEKKNLINEISLSARTITRRIEDIGTDLFEQLVEKVKSFQYFSLALDESTDIRDTAQLLIFIRAINDNFDIFEELAALCSLKGRTTAEDIFLKLQETVNTLGLKWENLKSVTTDGAKNMSGHKSGVVARICTEVKKAGAAAPPIVLHCIIHQQALCCKVLNWNSVMDVVISTVNFIRSHSLNHRQFQQFLTEIEAEYGDLLYYTEVRWLSRGNVLKRFFNLKDEIAIFMNEKGKEREELLDPEWILDLAFLVDITSLITDLNTKLQGKGKLVHEAFSDIKAFTMKLTLLSKHVLEKNLTHLPFCKIVFEKEVNSVWPKDKFKNAIEELQTEFLKRFADFYSHSKEIRLFQNPFTIDIEDVTDDLQMEVIDLQTNDILKDSFNSTSLVLFYSGLPPTAFSLIKRFANGMLTVFASTYICEQTFSLMKLMKSKHRSRLTDEHLHQTLRAASTSFRVDLNKMSQNIQHQVSH